MRTLISIQLVILGLSQLSYAKYNVKNLVEYNPVQKCEVVAEAYPEAVSSFDQAGNLVFLKNGRVLYCENPSSYNLNNKSEYLAQLNDVSVSDILSQSYPDSYSAPVFKYNESPGRIRSDQVFLNTYLDIEKLPESVLGITAKDSFSSSDLNTLNRYLREEIIEVDFLGFKIPFNKRNSAAESLRRVNDRLLNEAPESATWIKNNRNMAGGFNLRYISGTNRLSAHSWGIAIDFTLKRASENLNFNDSYWKWVSRCIAPLRCPEPRTRGSVEARNQASEKELEVLIVEDRFDHFPEEVVRVFAEEGFIWGGHWHHFDTMHFEYRPEFF